MSDEMDVQAILRTARVLRVRERIEQACARAGRPTDSVRLIAVTKYVSKEETAELYKQGLRDMGENRWQVLKQKLVADLPVSWHFIGPLQTNKVKEVLRHVSYVHSLDRVKLADALASEAQNAGISVRVLIQVNVTRESQKSGIAPEQIDGLLEHVLKQGEIEVAGLMTIGVQGADEHAARSTFARLRALRDRIEARFDIKLPELSMGMSADFLWAIEEGATMVRVGRELTGDGKNLQDSI